MKLYLIRHGQSEANRTASHAGWAQVPLTGQGEDEARALGSHLRGVTFDRIYTSDLLRARQTHVLALPDTKAEVTPLIREVNVGSLAGRRVEECRATLGEPYREARRVFDFHAWGGENYSEFCTRILEFLRQTAQEDCESVAAFCHGGVIHGVLDMLFSGTLNGQSPVPDVIGIDKPSFACPNCGVFVFEFSGGTWKMLTWNMFGA